MPYKNIAVIGAGAPPAIGGPIVEALVSEGAAVIVVTRPGSSSAKSFPPGVKTVSIGLTDVPALAAAFKEHQTEVVISTVGIPGLLHQKLIADAAKEAGVKLFVPSEFGFPTAGQTVGVLALKDQVGEYLKEIDLPFTRIFTGGFSTFIPWLTSVSSGKIKIYGGKGDTKASFTDPTDIAGFTAYVVTHLSPSQLSNKFLRVEGEHASMLDIISYYGPDVPVEYVDSFPGDELKETLHTIINGGMGSIGYDATIGRDLTGSDAAAANGLWPGHQWKSIKQSLDL